MQPKFAVEEKVLCYHGPLLYEAKCLKLKKENNVYQYFVHYQGWNKNWDEWVTEGRMLKQIGENFEKQKKLLATHMAQTKANRKAKKESKKGTKGGSDSGSNSRASTPVGDRPPGPGRPAKRSLADDERSTSSRDEELVATIGPTTNKEGPNSARKKKKEERDADESVEGGAKDNEGSSKYNIDIPEELKYVLVNDWDLVVHQKKLFSLPAKVTVNNIIDQYIDHLSNSSETVTTSKKSIAVEVIKGLGEYFNVSVGPQLLYGIEKLQYKEINEKEGAILPADLYGSPHLLRLMIKIGNYLDCTPYPEQNCKLLEDHIEDFLAYLEMNRSMFFTSKNYTVAPPDYLSRCNKS